MRIRRLIVNKPRVSGTIAGLYAVLTVFIAVLMAVFVYLALPLWILIVLALVEVVMLWLILSIYRTAYVLTDGELEIKAPIFIGRSKTVPLNAVRSVERTLIPFGIRLFGASFFGGYYYFPGLGRAFVTMTNFDDGVLIKADAGNFIITPRDPDGFVRAIKDRTKRRS